MAWRTRACSKACLAGWAARCCTGRSASAGQLARMRISYANAASIRTSHSASTRWPPATPRCMSIPGSNGLNTAFSAGRYLAGDWGTTIDVSRHFDNGVRMGAYATFTTAGSKYGEGSFDKGVYISVPFDLFLPWSKKRARNDPTVRTPAARRRRSPEQGLPPVRHDRRSRQQPVQREPRQDPELVAG